jgi:formate dehydrogenase gamma subunit
VNKRGFSWNDIFNPDVHNQQGVSCTACHPAGPDHQIAKGNISVSTVADHLDGTMKGCAECHMTGYLGASVPDHDKIRPSHMATITCESCHIPQLSRAAAQGHEASSGDLIFYTVPEDADGFGDTTAWNPMYKRSDNRKIYPFNSVLAIWWGNRDSDSLIHPLFLREHAEGWELFEDQVTDDNEDGEPEVNREEEIIAGLKAFAQTLEGNDRFDQVHPVLVKGEMAYELDAGGALVSSPSEAFTRVDFSISHNVAPARQALGANGCGDCHAPGAHFFQGARMLDMYGSDGQPVTESMGRAYGCSPISFAINSFHQQIVSPYVGVAVMLVIFGIVMHYHSYGPKRITFDPYSQEIERFTLFERAVHLFRLIAFILLSITGLILAFNLHLWQELLFSSAEELLNWHIWSGVVFIITTVCGMFLWFKDALFASYDKEWVRRIGGYLGYRGKVPAGRFNAGQKMFYWYTTIFGTIMIVTGLVLIFKSLFSLSTICITSTVHNLIGFVLIAGVMAHAYLGTIANPGTWRVLVDGSVTREWAQHHHINWFKEVMRKRLEGPREKSDNDAAEDKNQSADS